MHEYTCRPMCCSLQVDSSSTSGNYWLPYSTNQFFEDPLPFPVMKRMKSKFHIINRLKPDMKLGLRIYVWNFLYAFQKSHNLSFIFDNNSRGRITISVCVYISAGDSEFKSLYTNKLWRKKHLWADTDMRENFPVDPHEEKANCVRKGRIINMASQ